MEDRIAGSVEIEQALKPTQTKGLNRREFLTALGGLAGTVAAGAVLGGCTQASPQPAATASGPVATAIPTVRKPSAITVATFDSIGALDPRFNRGVAEVHFLNHVYDGLVEFDPDKNENVRPRLAESIEAVNPTTWRFRLRSGIKFHNGEDFTAETVKSSIDQIVKMDPAYYYTSQWESGWPPSVEIESATSVLMKTPKPLPFLPKLLTRVAMIPTKASAAADFAEKPVGTGPYRFVQWAKGVSVVLEANANYWRGAPKIGQVTYRTIADDTARQAALEAGEIEMAVDLPPESASLSKSKFTVIETPSLSQGTWLMSYRRGKGTPIVDIRVRRALLYAVDGPAILGQLLGGKAIAAQSSVPTRTYGQVDLGGYPKRDVAMCKRLLAEAGYGSGLELVLLYAPKGIMKSLEVTEALQQQLKEAGVNVKIEQTDAAAFLERRGTATWDIAHSSTTGWTGDADFFLNSPIGQLGYESTAMAAARTSANSATDPNQRLKYLADAQKIQWDDVPFLFSFQTINFAAMTTRLRGVSVLPQTWHYLWAAELTS